jgi:hypothetical protein
MLKLEITRVIYSQLNEDAHFIGVTGNVLGGKDKMNQRVHLQTIISRQQHTNKYLKKQDSNRFNGYHINVILMCLIKHFLMT